MYCNNCGNRIVGKYCSRCGKRARTDDREEYLALQREKRRFIEGRMLAKGGNITARSQAANCSWRMAVSFYEQKHDNRILSDKNCPSDAKDWISKEAECIARVLDAEIYRATAT